MSCIYIAYSWDIMGIYNVYPIEILCIYRLNLFDIHNIFMVYPVLAPFTCRSILIQQLRSLCFQISANLLCVSEREHMIRVLELIPGTPAACALCRGTHSGRGHLITVHR